MKVRDYLKQRGVVLMDEKGAKGNFNGNEARPWGREGMRGTETWAGCYSWMEVRVERELGCRRWMQ